MKKLVLLWTLASMPLLAVANPYGQEQGGGMGMQGGGMQGGGMQGGMRPPGPPPEFFSACQGKKEGDAVTVNGPHGQMKGTCRLMFAPTQQGQGGGQGGMQGGGGQGGMGQRQGGMGQPGQRQQ